jgi:type VI secretion system protein ImpI
MTLRLAIENMDRLPDGGPLRVEVKARGIDIGRDAHLDWTLPDPSRYVSSKHCEIRYRDNEYWLYDVSTNGTFVNGGQFRLDAPYRLRDRDRLSIGPYIIAVAIEGGRAEPVEAAGFVGAAAPAAADVWGAVGEVAPPEGREAYRVRKGPARPGDFLDFATDAGVTPGSAAPSVWSQPDAPAAAAVWSQPAAPAPMDEAWLTSTPPPIPVPPPPDPRALPLVERPRPIRPAEPVAASPIFEPAAARAAEPTPSPSFEPPARVLEPPARVLEPPARVFEPPARVLEPLAAAAEPAAVFAPAAPPPQPPRPAPPRPASDATEASLLNRIAAAAGIPPSAIAGRDPNEVADEIGEVLRLTAESLIQMAASRRQTKSAIRSAQHTMYKPAENNPIKFAAGPEHAMETMFGPPSRIHLRAPAAVAQVFNEAKAHNVLTYGAMQNALEALFAELAPDKIEASLEPERGLSAMVASRKARLWDAYAERWRTLTKRSDGRLNDAFMGLFSEAYDRLNEQGG